MYPAINMAVTIFCYNDYNIIAQIKKRNLEYYVGNPEVPDYPPRFSIFVMGPTTSTSTTGVNSFPELLIQGFNGEDLYIPLIVPSK